MRYPERKVYQYFTYQKLKSEEVEIIELLKVNVSSKRELEKIENEYIQKELNNKLCMNTKGAFFDEEDKKEYMLLYNQQYRKDNAEKLKTYDHIRNKTDKRKEYMKEKLTCICGSKIGRRHMSEHLKTYKHLNFIKIQNENSVNTIE